MSKLPLFTLLCLVLSLLVGCPNKQPDCAIQRKDTPFDSDIMSLQGCDNKQPDCAIQQKNTPFGTDNKTLLFSQIEATVDSAIRASNVNYIENSLSGYYMWDSVTYSLYSPDLYILDSNSQLARHCNGVIEYLNWHLRRIINAKLTDKRISNALDIEDALTDSLLNAQYKWIQSHFDATQFYLGTASDLKYYNIEFELLRLRNTNLMELLYALTDTTYNISTQRIISPDLFEPEYHHILSECIPYYSNDSVYSEDADRQNFVAETEAWQRLMDKRTQIFHVLSGNAKDAYNHGTYRLMFNRLRQLKNEFEAYRLMSNSVRELTLSDSCTYHELMAYPNFSTLWNEYQKRFEQ